MVINSDDLAVLMPRSGLEMYIICYTKETQIPD